MTGTSLLDVVSPRTRAALRLADEAHQGKVRRGTTNSYLTHVVAVADVVAAAGGSADLIAAAYVHDAVEDTPVTLERVRADLGPEVARLVGAVTKGEETKGAPLSAHAAATVAKVVAAGADATALKACDLLVNISDLVFDAAQRGVECFAELFGPQRVTDKIEHYVRLAHLLDAELRRHTAWTAVADALASRRDELARLLTQVPQAASSRDA